MASFAVEKVETEDALKVGKDSLLLLLLFAAMLAHREGLERVIRSEGLEHAGRSILMVTSPGASNVRIR